MGQPRQHQDGDTGNGQSDSVAVVPRLTLVNTTVAGVTLGFDARLVSRLRFRASLPLCCINCREDDPEELTARPIAWVIRIDGAMLAIPEVEARYEARVKPHQSTRDVTRGLQPICEFPAPFNEPMPFYVCTRCASGQSANGDAIGTSRMPQCEVTVPSARYALEWLERVNGVCGNEFTELESVVRESESPGWQAVPANVRERIAAWFTAQAGERFLLYAPDCDLPKRDAGLAGVVLTDRRLIYHKYRRSREIPAERFHRLAIDTEEGFPVLFYQRQGAYERLAKLRPEAAAKLGLFLGESPIIEPERT